MKFVPDVYNDFVDSEITHSQEPSRVLATSGVNFMFMWLKAFKCVPSHKRAKQSKFRINGTSNITSLAVILSGVCEPNNNNNTNYNKVWIARENEHITCSFPLTRLFHHIRTWLLFFVLRNWGFDFRAVADGIWGMSDEPNELKINSGV